METLEIVRSLETHRQQIVEETVQQALTTPFWVQRFGEDIHVRLTLDMDRNIGVLIQSIRYRSPMIFEDHTRWRRDQIQGFGCASGHLRELYGHMWQAMTRHIPANWHATLSDYMQSALDGLVYPGAASRALAEQQTLVAADLATATFDRHWHWQAAYSTDGRPQLLYDLWYLLDYLVDSLGAAGAATFGAHLRWLRQELIRRGLSTAHVQQLVWLLTTVLEARLDPGAAEKARHILLEAMSTLLYPNESCLVIQSAQSDLIGPIANRLIATGFAPNHSDTAIEASWYVAYLLESLAANSPEPLFGYMRWVQHWLEDQGLPDGPLRLSLETLHNTLQSALPEPIAREAGSILRAARQALQTEPRSALASHETMRNPW